MTNTTNRLDTREFVGRDPDRVHQQDIALVSDATLRAAGGFFMTTPAIKIPAGGYDYQTTHVEYQAGRAVKGSGTLFFETGTFPRRYQRHTIGEFFHSGRRRRSRLETEPADRLGRFARRGTFTAKVVRNVTSTR